MRIILVWLLLFTTALAAPLTDRATGLVFPGNPGRWLRVDYREYEPKEILGVSYSYKAESQSHGAITCYVYAKGLSTIPDGGDSEVVRAEMAEVAWGVGAGGQQRGAEVVELLAPRFLLAAPAGTKIGLVCVHRINERGISSISITVVSGYRNQFLKIRHTFPGTDMDEALNSLRAFSSHLFSANNTPVPQITIDSQVQATARQRNITAVYAADIPDAPTASIWLAYALMRARQRQESGVGVPDTAGEIMPNFSEEIAGRTGAVQVYREVKQNQPGWHSPYWEDMQRIEEAGFMPAYVWTFHRREHWPAAAAPNTLKAFGKWQKKKLKSHTPETRGALHID